SDSLFLWHTSKNLPKRLSYVSAAQRSRGTHSRYWILRPATHPASYLPYRTVAWWRYFRKFLSLSGLHLVGFPPDQKGTARPAVATQSCHSRPDIPRRAISPDSCGFRGAGSS